MPAAIVIPGAAVWPGGQPSPTLERRVNRAAEMWHQGGHDLIVPTGGLGKHPPAEADVMRRILLEHGVPDAAILPEPHATSTLTNAVFCAAVLASRGITHVTVVSDAYHLPRCWLAFRRAGLSPHLVSADSASPQPRAGPRMKGWVREMVALPVYALRLALRPLPSPPE